MAASCLIHSDNPHLLIGAFKPLIFKVNIGVTGLIYRIFVPVFYFLSLFSVSILSFTLFSVFCGFNCEFYMIPFFLLSNMSAIPFFFFNFFSCCPRVWNINLQLMQFQTTLYQTTHISEIYTYISTYHIYIYIYKCIQNQNHCCWCYFEQTVTC